MDDQYTKLAKYYDEFVQKNRDYHEIATELAQLIGEGRELLDIGIGTGLIVENLLAIESSYNITGIDTSSALLEEAGKRLTDGADLYCQSVSELSLEKSFDVAYSRGGAWTFVEHEAEVMLASHLCNLDDIQQSFDRVAKHLKVGGLLIISASNAYGDNMVNMDNGVVHQRKASSKIVAAERYAVLDYLFYQDEALLAEQTLQLRLLNYKQCASMLETSGLREKVIEVGKYYIYQKI